jgi:hypothetical protein
MEISARRTNSILSTAGCAPETWAEAFAEILADHGGGSGVAYAWELQLLDQKAGAGA